VRYGYYCYFCCLVHLQLQDVLNHYLLKKSSTPQHKVGIKVDDVSNIFGCITITLEVTNKSNNSITVNSSDFTITREDNGSTFTPNAPDNEVYLALHSYFPTTITLQPEQKTSGIIEYSMLNAEGEKILSFNNASGSQQIKIKVPPSK